MLVESQIGNKASDKDKVRVTSKDYRDLVRAVFKLSEDQTDQLILILDSIYAKLIERALHSSDVNTIELDLSPFGTIQLDREKLEATETETDSVLSNGKSRGDGVIKSISIKDKAQNTAIKAIITQESQLETLLEQIWIAKLTQQIKFLL